ncbi:MAG: LLM class flavin-dependent oxidoreductase [Alphaproteobacteria bacterium]|nr:LLM class flavin-dependent oxidoreductase [Alphaproteobacteria bacterium]MBU1512654.1 LLM class flavin-dependent oxidoreductase [Alphaproteobacteria bacterium]MBU2095048.1 LLM class flavin-dependent oxidoreductase [Alphaproteobacteria bacterium]MBU2151833.1 LLM class flavin-dependent oxidoreductase [Alphaproteobacteria bacterium]MBU2306232.1 LLM class flavin-dependent oxidoreductase [Alphaproteobacteria bacterium]
MIPLSVLDLSPIVQGGSPGQSLRASRALALAAERLGYERYWLAEHHNMTGIASAATAVALAYVGDGTSTIRLGAGGVMLPNHAPLIIAEQFGTLEALYPGRVDLGVGRAPGTDQLTARAMRRNLTGDVDQFPRDVLELMAFLKEAQPGQAIRAVPGSGSNVPVWILGSSLFGAQLAAALGLPFAFASHFAPQMMDQAAAIYREQFEPSEYRARPHLMLGLNVVAGETDAEAKLLFSSLQQAFINLHSGRPGPLPPPREDPDGLFAGTVAPGSPLSKAVVGGPETVRAGLEQFVSRHRPDEIIVTAQIFDQAKRIRSLELVAQARDALALAA